MEKMIGCAPKREAKQAIAITLRKNNHTPAIGKQPTGLALAKPNILTLSTNVNTPYKDIRASLQRLYLDESIPLNHALASIKDWCKNNFEIIRQFQINTDNSHHREEGLVRRTCFVSFEPNSHEIA